jgi:hypothetical protein
VTGGRAPRAEMIDDPAKTESLLAAMRAHMPFAVRLAPALLRYLRSQSPPVVVAERQMVRDLHYLGDEGGIVCSLDPGEGKNAIVASLTHLLVPPPHPLAAEAARYRKRRIKRLKKLGRA